LDDKLADFYELIILEKEKKMKSVNNLFSSLQNGQKAKKHLINIPKTKIACDILNILLAEGYICGFAHTKLDFVKKGSSCNDDKHKSQIQILLKYINEEPVIKKIRQVSSSGCRVYIDYKKVQLLPSACFLILSTSKGVMTNKNAKSFQIGGEILCRII
jgi:small subunit ribosomal protein S8